LFSSAEDDKQHLVVSAKLRLLRLAAVQESLRIRPPVGVLARYGPKGATLAGYNISEKVLLVSPYIQHMDKDVWGQDAEEFRPERWLDVDGPAQHVNQYSYLPFSRGPRDCIGSRFALLEAKTILSMIYRQFEFEYAGEKPEEVLMSVTAHPKYGVPLRVRRRKAAATQQPAAAEAAPVAVRR
jgi:cytochrome P450